MPGSPWRGAGGWGHRAPGTRSLPSGGVQSAGRRHARQDNGYTEGPSVTSFQYHADGMPWELNSCLWYNRFLNNVILLKVTEPNNHTLSEDLLDE